MLKRNVSVEHYQVSVCKTDKNIVEESPLTTRQKYLLLTIKIINDSTERDSLVHTVIGGTAASLVSASSLTGHGLARLSDLQQ